MIKTECIQNGMIKTDSIQNGIIKTDCIQIWLLTQYILIYMYNSTKNSMLQRNTFFFMLSTYTTKIDRGNDEQMFVQILKISDNYRKSSKIWFPLLESVSFCYTGKISFPLPLFTCKTCINIHNTRTRSCPYEF